MRNDVPTLTSYSNHCTGVISISIYRLFHVTETKHTDLEVYHEFVTQIRLASSREADLEQVT